MYTLTLKRVKVYMKVNGMKTPKTNVLPRLETVIATGGDHKESRLFLHPTLGQWMQSVRTP